jgi:2-polyprenyl-3-methyl-5-hydroxy-6-metoxy-1,4-benzoquinol methylase
MSLENIYRSHHNERRGEFFILQGSIRGDFLSKNIGTGKKVLDIGCRDGALTSKYSLGNNVTGLDIDGVALDKASKNLGIRAIKTDLNEDWPVENGTYDVVVAAEIIEHLYYPDAVLKRINKALKEGGVLLGSLPNAFSLKNRFRYLLGRKKNTPLSDPTHINHFSRKEFESLLSKNFKEFETYPIGRYAFLDKFFPGLFCFMFMFKAKK